MCIACVMRGGTLAPAGQDQGREGGSPDALGDWSEEDTAKAIVVYRQLPRWSRRVFDVLSAAPGRQFPVSQLWPLVSEPDSPFSMQDVCGWAVPFCAAVGRSLPVHIGTSASGEPTYHMDQPAARLFELTPAVSPPMLSAPPA
jgi:hypothetical protein